MAFKAMMLSRSTFILQQILSKQINLNQYTIRTNKSKSISNGGKYQVFYGVGVGHQNMSKFEMHCCLEYISFRKNFNSFSMLITITRVEH